MAKDNINPDHYKSETSLECIEAMELLFGFEAVLNFCVCNAWKYIWRWKNKNGVEDLEKAKWYIARARGYVGPEERESNEFLDRLSEYVINEIRLNTKVGTT